MSATEALDAYLERQQSSKKASSSARAVGKPQGTLRAAANAPSRLSKAPESRSRLGTMAKGPMLKAGAPGADDTGREGAIKAVWPPSPLDEKDERPLLAKAHPATARMAHRKPSEKAAEDKVGALTKLKRLSSSRLRNASGGSPRVQAGSEAAQPDHFAAALEKLRRDQQAEQTSKQQGKQQSAGQHSLAHAAAGENSRESPGQQRRARWDPLADTEDRLALQRLTQKAAALSSHPSPTKDQRSDGADKQLAEGTISFASQLRLAFPAAPARSDGPRSKREDSAQTQQAKESAEVLNEVLLELRAAEERFTEQQNGSTGPSYLTQAAHHEASALGAVTAWYRDVQRKHAAAGLGDDPIIASILPGSSRTLAQREAPPGSEPQAEPTDGSQAGPLLQALLASLPKVPEIPRKAPEKLPFIERVLSSPEQQSQGHTAADAPPDDFAAKFSGLAEDMPRLPRDSFLQGSSQEMKPASAVASPQPGPGVPHPSLPMQQEGAEPPAVPAQSPQVTSATTVAPVVVPRAPQHIPSSVGRDLALLQQRWQGYHEPPLSKPVPAPDGSVLSKEALPHQLTEGVPTHQDSMGQQHSSTGLSELVSGLPAPSQMGVSPSARAASDRAQPGLQGRSIHAEDRAAPALSPLSALSPVVGTPVEFYAYTAPPAAGAVPVPVQERSSKSGFSYQAACSPGEHMVGRPRSDLSQAPLSHSSIRQLWGHPERKEGGPDPWAAGQAGRGPAWAAQDRAASALLDSHPRGSTAHLSEVELPRHSTASEQMGFSSTIADSLTEEASVSLMAKHFDRYHSHASLSQYSGSSTSVASGCSQGGSRNPSIAPPHMVSSMDCVSNAFHGAGVLDALLADALSQEEGEMHDVHGLPGGLGLLSHEQHAGVSGRLLLEGDVEAAGLEPELAVSRPGSNRASLVAHYMQRGRAAYKAASSGAV